VKVGIPRPPVELLDSHRLMSLERQACYIALLYVTVNCDFRCTESKKCP